MSGSPRRQAFAAVGALVGVLVACAPSAPLAPAPASASPEVAPSASVASSAEPASSETPDAEFRQRPPPAGAEGSFQAPVPADLRLPNGMRVLLLSNHGMPVVSMQLVVNRGAAHGPPGAAALLGPMLLQGTPTRSLFELSDTLEEMGARHRVTVDEDAVLVSATVLSSDAPRALALLGDAVRNASLPESEMERLRGRKIQSLAVENDLPRALLQRAVVELLYPPRHPYRVSALLDERALRALHRSDLRRFHREHVQPDSVTLVVAGDIDRTTLQAAAAAAFGSWQGKATPVRPPATPSAPTTGPSVLLVDLPGAPQTSVALCAVGAPYTSPDHDDLLVLGTLLTRRLNANLRGRHAYTYGVSSQFSFRHGAGPFMAGGDVVRDHTADAIKEALSELTRLRDEPVKHDELNDAKAIVGALSARFETAESSVIAMTPLAIYKLGDDDFLTLRVRLQMVTRESIQKAARTYLASPRLRLALVGDAATIEAPVRALDLGPVEVRKNASPARRPPPPPETPVEE